jgi:hypothetical protein
LGSIDPGSAVPLTWLPTNRKAGPGPVITRRAVPCPSKLVKPVLSRSTTMVQIR